MIDNWYVFIGFQASIVEKYLKPISGCKCWKMSETLKCQSTPSPLDMLTDECIKREIISSVMNHVQNIQSLSSKEAEDKSM